jgi:hypothetical protein
VVAAKPPLPNKSTPAAEKKKGKKYKPVDKKIRLVDGVHPMNTLVETAVPEDPLISLPQLSKNPPEFVPTGHFTCGCHNLSPGGLHWS